MRDDKSFNEMTPEQEEWAKKKLGCDECMFCGECAFPCKKLIPMGDDK